MKLYYKFIILFSLSVTLLFAGMSSGTAGYVFKPKGYDGKLFDFFLPNGMKVILMDFLEVIEMEISLDPMEK